MILDFEETLEIFWQESGLSFGSVHSHLRTAYWTTLGFKIFFANFFSLNDVILNYVCDTIFFK